MTRMFPLALAAIATLSAPAFAQENKQLNTNEIQATFANRTATADDQMVEFHAPDGVAIIRSREDGKMVVRVGTWKAKSNTVCYKYTDDLENEYCWRVYRMADGVHFLWGTENQIIVEIGFRDGDSSKLERRVSPEARAQALSIR